MRSSFKDYLEYVSRQISVDFVNWALFFKSSRSALIYCYKWEFKIEAMEGAGGLSNHNTKTISIGTEMLLSRQISTLVHEARHLSRINVTVTAKDLKKSPDLAIAINLYNEAKTLEYERKAIKQIAKYLPLDTKSTWLLKTPKTIVDIINWATHVNGKSYWAYFKNGLNDFNNYPDEHVLH